MIPRAVIFDVDGTLIDTREVHLRCWQQTLQEFGKQVSRAEIEALFGQHTTEWLRHFFTPAEQRTVGDAVAARKDRLFAERLPEVKPFPGAAEILREVKARGRQVALATGALAHELEVHLDTLHARELVDAIVDGSEVTHGKPHPDVYLRTAEKLGRAPAECVAVGDSLYDVIAARAAGMPCIALLTGGFSEAQLREAGAVEVYADIESLRRAWAASQSPSG